MNIGSRITQLRKQKSLSQTDLAKAVEASREIIGRYERNEVTPSIDMAKKIADVLEVSLDYLVGETDNTTLDKKTVRIIQEIESLEPTIQEKLFFLVGAIIRDAKARKAHTDLPM